MLHGLRRSWSVEPILLGPERRERGERGGTGAIQNSREWDRTAHVVAPRLSPLLLLGVVAASAYVVALWFRQSSRPRTRVALFRCTVDCRVDVVATY